jgi:hypothetical protein
MKQSARLRYLILPLLALALAACRGAAPDPAAPPPLADRDLATVVLQADEFPAEYETYAIDSFEGVFPQATEAHTGVVTSTVAYAMTSDKARVFSNGIVRYRDAAQAQKAFDAIKEGTREGGGFYKLPDFGDQHYTMNDAITSEALGSTKIFLSLILWRMDDAVIYVSAADNSAPPAEPAMIKLAQTLHTRLTGAPAK